MNSLKTKADLKREKLMKDYNILVYDHTKVRDSSYNTLNKIEKKELGSFSFGQKKESFYRHEPFFNNLKEMKKVRHPLLLTLYGVIENDSTHHYDYAIELIKGFSLSQQIKYQSNTDIEQIMIALDLCKILQYLHENDYVHRQLFPKNAILDYKKDFRLLVDFSVMKKVNSKALEAGGKWSKSFQDIRNTDIRKEFDIWAFGNFLNELFSGGDKLWIQIGQDNSKTLSLLYEQYPYTISSRIKNDAIREIIEICAEVKTGSKGIFDISDINLLLYKEFFRCLKDIQLNFLTVFAHYSDKERFYLFNKIRSYLVLHKFYLNKKQSKVDDFNFLTIFYIKQDKYTRRMSRSFTKSQKISLEELISRPITKDNVKKFISTLKLSVIQSDQLTDKKEILGEGGFATVKKAVFNGLDIALKKLNVFDIEKFTKEIIIIKKYNHPNIPLLYGLIQKSKDGSQAITFEIAFEFIKGATLDVYMLNRKIVPELEKFLIMLDLAQVIEYLHAFNLIHRDLKPQNIMINEKREVKLFDFGVSKISKNSETKTKEGTGTCFYMAPENYPENKYTVDMPDEDESVEEDPDPEELNIKISNKIDIWAFGLITNELFTGEKPWNKRLSKNAPHQIRAIQAQQLLIQRANFEPSASLKDDIKNVVSACTRINPKERPTMKQVKEHLLKLLFFYVREVKDLETYFVHEVHKDKFYLLNKIRNYIKQYKLVAVKCVNEHKLTETVNDDLMPVGEHLREIRMHSMKILTDQAIKEIEEFGKDKKYDSKKRTAKPSGFQVIQEIESSSEEEDKEEKSKGFKSLERGKRKFEKFSALENSKSGKSGSEDSISLLNISIVGPEDNSPKKNHHEDTFYKNLKEMDNKIKAIQFDGDFDKILSLYAQEKNNKSKSSNRNEGDESERKGKSSRREHSKSNKTKSVDFEFDLDLGENLENPNKYKRKNDENDIKSNIVGQSEEKPFKKSIEIILDLDNRKDTYGNTKASNLRDKAKHKTNKTTNLSIKISSEEKIHVDKITSTVNLKPRNSFNKRYSNVTSKISMKSQNEEEIFVRRKTSIVKQVVESSPSKRLSEFEFKKLINEGSSPKNGQSSARVSYMDESTTPMVARAPKRHYSMNVSRFSPKKEEEKETHHSETKSYFKFFRLIKENNYKDYPVRDSGITQYLHFNKTKKIYDPEKRESFTALLKKNSLKETYKPFLPLLESPLSMQAIEKQIYKKSYSKPRLLQRDLNFEIRE